MSDNINTADIKTSIAMTTVSHSTSSSNHLHSSKNPGSLQWTQTERGESVPIVSVPLSSSSSPLTVMIQPSVITAVEWEAKEGVAKNVNTAPGGNAGKKPAWEKTFKVATEPGSDTEAFVRPQLSALNISSSDSSRAPLDGSSSTPFPPVSQGSRTASASSSAQNQVRNNSSLNANSVPNHTMPARQRSVNVSASNGVRSQPPPQVPMVEAPLNGSSSRDHIQRTGFAPYTGGNDQRNPRNSFRHHNSGPQGNGFHHLNHGGRRNQDHGNQDWSGQNFSYMHGYMLPRGGPSFVMHPPVPPYLAPPHGLPMGYPEYPSQFYLVPAPYQEPHRGVPPLQPMSLMFFPPEFHDYQLRVRILDQIHHYFSTGNLIKDIYLRKNMDDQGWVPIKLIAGFRRISLLTNNIQLILYALQSSTELEVQGDKVRKRYDWMRWIIPSSIKFPSNDTSSGSSSMEFNNESKLSGNEGISVDARGGPSGSST